MPGPDKPDRRSLPPLLGEAERQDILQIHRAILSRERVEPQEGMEPAPWWVWVVSVLVIFSMGFYLGRYSGTFSTEAHELYQKAAVGGGEAAAEPPPDGSLVYAGICLPCHQAGGTGVEGKYPPLAGSEWVAKDSAIGIRILLHGLQGPIQVKGKTFNNEMPGLGNQLSDAEIAAVLTYVRSNFGNKAPAVDTKQVAAIRQATPGQGPWTAQALSGVPK
ncbi:MAG: cytochrome c [Bryobacterales bacterium]|nr:cytochrome c [Bryobacterales bacterium]